MFLTTSQAAEELGCAVTTYRRLVRAGVLPGLVHRGVRVMTPLPVVQALRQRSHAALHQLDADEIGVLRVDASAPATRPDGQQWSGYSAALAPGELLRGLKGWWRCDAATVAAGHVLPVTLAGYVVALLTGVHTWEKDTRSRYAFPQARLAGHITDLATPTKVVTATTRPDRDLAELLLGSRLPTHSGGAIAYVRTRTADPLPGKDA
ncbi:DNA-binding protein [Streptomyces albidoflavus]